MALYWCLCFPSPQPPLAPYPNIQWSCNKSVWFYGLTPCHVTWVKKVIPPIKAPLIIDFFLCEQTIDLFSSKIQSFHMTVNSSRNATVSKMVVPFFNPSSLFITCISNMENTEVKL